MHSRKSRNILKFYFPGLISLIFLPALCLWFISTNKTYQKLYALDVVFWSPDLKKLFPKTYINGSHPPRQYLEIELNGNEKDDLIRLDFAQIQIKDLVETNDPKKGVHFKFGSKARYWAFIQALDIFKIIPYVPYGNDIWVFNFVPEKPISKTIRLYCGCLLCNDVVYEKTEQEVEAERLIQIAFIKASLQKYSIPLLVFLVMSVWVLFRKC